MLTCTLLGMTTWELAGESELKELRLLIGRVECAGGSSPLIADGLSGTTKRRAGQMRTMLCELITNGDPRKGARA